MNEETHESRILAVGKDHTIAGLIQEILTSRDYQVDLAFSSKDCLEYAASNSPDLILLGLVLPDGNGMETLRRLKSETTTSHIPVIIVSGLTGRNYQLQAANLGASAFIEKPFELTELVNAVENVLQRERRPLVAGPAVEARKPDAETILVVDDEEEMLDLCETVLWEAGFNITTAHDGKEALAKLESKRFRGVLTDNVQIPPYNRSVLQEIKLRWPDTNVVVMSNSEKPEYAHQVLKEGALDFLKKPFQIDRLVSAMKRCVATNRNSPHHHTSD